MKKPLFILTVLAVLAFVLSCKKKKEPEKPDLGAAYYPTSFGKYVIYDVDSIVFDEFTYDSTFYKYQVKEKIEGDFIDQQGRPALRLVRYIKKFNAAVSYSAMPWTVKDVWQVNVSKSNVEVVEENVRFVKLTFPVKQNNTWNGNVTNTMDEWEYKYSYIDRSETIGGIGLPKVALVIQKHFPTLISREDYSEKYAKDIGLVFREIIDLKYKNVVSNVNISWQNVPQKWGVVYNAVISSYGTEQ